MRTKVLATTPLFVVADLQHSVDFYCTKLGFTDPTQWGEPPCFAMIHRDGFDLMLSLAGKPDQVRPNGPIGVWDVYMKVADVQDELAALKTVGVKIESGPKTTEYGMTEIEILDPDGHRICMGQDTA